MLKANFLEFFMKSMNRKRLGFLFTKYRTKEITEYVLHYGVFGGRVVDVHPKTLGIKETIVL